MKKLWVHYEGWGERWPLGTLAENGRQLLFEYSPEALAQGLELSPHKLKLAPGTYGDFPDHLMRLPGLVCDSLPDGWGLLLMDKLCRQAGRDPATLSALDRLAFVGTRGMGALAFEPASPHTLPLQDWRLLQLAREAQALLQGRESDVLATLALMGGSPHGARPKVLVHFNSATGQVSTSPTPGAHPWLVKFPAQHEHREVCALEQLYAHLARACGLRMPDTAFFDLDPRLAAFGIARFDVEGGQRVPIHTLAGALHADFRLPGAVDALTFLRLTRRMTRSEPSVQEAFERCAFNVLFHNRDDHAKNVSFRLERDRAWALAPCYDLGFHAGPGGEHHMDVLGHGSQITQDLMLELAHKASLDKQWALNAMARLLAVWARFDDVLEGSGMGRHIRAASLKTVKAAIGTNAKLWRQSGA